MVDNGTQTQNQMDKIRYRQKLATGWVLGLNILFLVLVAGFGFYVNSLVLLASAVHLIADTASLAIAYIAIVLSSRPVSTKHTFGLVRTEVLGALVNGAVLLATSIWIIVEAVRDIPNPHPVSSIPIIALGIVGLFASGASLAALHRNSGKSLNMKAGVVHMAGDAVGWLVTILSGVLIATFGIYRADSIGSIVISLLVLASSWKILSQTVAVLLEATPRAMSPDEIRRTIEADPKILNVHHLHLWNLASDTTALSTHVLMVDGMTLHLAQIKVQELKEMLRARYGIDHVTVEVECHRCGDSVHTLEE